MHTVCAYKVVILFTNQVQCWIYTYTLHNYFVFACRCALPLNEKKLRKNKTRFLLNNKLSIKSNISHLVACDVQVKTEHRVIIFSFFFHVRVLGVKGQFAC